MFLCTDSAGLRRYFGERERELVLFDSTLADHGPLHRPEFGLRGAEEALIEMWLLSQCQGLVYNPSWFTHYARVLGRFDHPPIDIDGRSLYGTAQLYRDRVAGRRSKFSISTLARRLLR